MDNLISKRAYASFVIEHLARMEAVSVEHLHIIWSLKEELLELDSELNPALYHFNELEIWREVKPVVKYMRAKRTFPTTEELLVFKETQIVTRTLRNGETISKTFNEHVKDIDAEVPDINFPEPNPEKILKELGDVLFFVVAAKEREIKSPVIEKAKREIDKQSPVFREAEIRQHNYEKLSSRFKNGYTVSEDLHRKNK